MDPKTIKANENNDLKLFGGMNVGNPNKIPEEKVQKESTETEPGKMEYFCE